MVQPGSQDYSLALMYWLTDFLFKLDPFYTVGISSLSSDLKCKLHLSGAKNHSGKDFFKKLKEAKEFII